MPTQAQKTGAAIVWTIVGVGVVGGLGWAVWRYTKTNRERIAETITGTATPQAPEPTPKPEKPIEVAAISL